MGKLDKYWEWRFNIERFVRDYPENRRILQDKREALAEIAEVRHLNYSSPPGTPGRGDSVPASAQTAEKLRAEIEEYQELVNLYENAENQLSDEEKMITRYFFHMPGKKGSKCRYLSRVLHYEKTAIYGKRREALEKIRKYIRV